MEPITPASLTLRHGGWPAVHAVALAIFAVVTTEMLPVGLMAPIASSFDIAVGVAGLTISVPAMVAALFAPLIIVMAGRIDRRHILAGLLVLLVAANLMAMFAASFSWLVGARILVGFCMGGIWAIAGGLAPRLLPPKSADLAANAAADLPTDLQTHQATPATCRSGTHSIAHSSARATARTVARATAVIFSGVAAASVLGVPLGALIDSLYGWRAAFGAMAAFSLVVLGLNLWTLPPLPIDQAIDPTRFKAALRLPLVRPGLMLTILLVGGHFMAYTFVTPVLLTLSAVPASAISLLLFVYGASGIIGNFLAGMMAARRVRTLIGGIACMLAATLLGFALRADNILNATALLVIWGLVYGGVSVALQTWMMKAAPAAIEIVTALFVSVFNIGIAAGSFIGGRILDRFDLQINLMAAASLAALAFFTLLLLAINRQRPHDAL